MIEQYTTKIIISGDTIQYWLYSKPIEKGYKSDRINYEKKLVGKKRNDSVHRSRNNMIQLIDSNVNFYSKFITLTTKEPIYDRKTFMEYFNNFKKHFKRKIGDTFEYVGVIEGQMKRQKKYNLPFPPLHLHLIVFYSKKIDFKTLKSCWTYGSVDLKKVDDNANLSIYMAKYLTKETMSLNKKGFIRSRSLKKPQQYTTDSSIIPNEYSYYKSWYGNKNGRKDLDSIFLVEYFEVRPKKLDKIRKEHKKE